MGKFLRKLGGGKKNSGGRGGLKSRQVDFDDSYEEDDYDYEYDEDEEDYDEEEYDADDEAEAYDEEEEYEVEEYEPEEDAEAYYEDEEDYGEEEYDADDEAEAYDEEEEYEVEEYEPEEDAEAYYEDEEDYDEEEYETEDEAEGYYEEEEYEVEEYEPEEDAETYYEDEEDYDGEEYEAEDDEVYYEDDEAYDDEAYYEDEEDYDEDYDYEDEEDDYDYEDEVPEGVAAKAVYKLRHLTAVDYIVALTGAAVLIVVVVTGTLFMNAKSNKSQIEAFAEIGVGMEDMSIIGESGLIAVADAQTAKYMAATMETQEPEEEETEETQENESTGKTAVIMNLTSIQKDLKIKFINQKTGKLISNLKFKVEITKPSGGTYTMEDEDKDGIIYQTGIEAGKYKIKIVGPDSDDTYSISTEQMSVTVKDTIEYKKVDVSDEVKTEAQVNAAAEDTKVNETVVESTNTDTVEWVESTKTLIEGTETKEDSYEKVAADQIADPGKTAAGFMLLTASDGAGAGKAGVPQAHDDPPSEGEPASPSPAGEPTEAPEEATPSPSEKPTDAPEPSEEPTAEPTKAPEKTEEPKPTDPPTPTPAEPTATPVVTTAPTPTALPTATPTATPAVTPTGSPTATPSATATPTGSPTASPTATPNDAKNDTTTTLKTTKGETLYIKNSDGTFREAKYADYYTAKEFYRLVSKTGGEYKYTGWQVIDGVTYFFDKNGEKVTGEQVIQGAKYNFNSDGSLNTGSGHMGIDVSKWNGNIDWNAVKNSGVSYVIIRCGYRGSSTGALIEDPMFRSNIQGASKAGLKVGVYFFTQAVNEVEAVEEASMVLGLIKGYGLSYPVFLDVEASNGRADSISPAARTAVCKAFCQTIQNSGYKAGIYANKTWLTSHMDAPSLTGYKIWLAQYAAAPTYNKTRYDMWQYSSKGSVAGIKGNVDMNISYMGY